MIRVSAPGKAILMGEHAAVYGRPALVAALDRRVFVDIEDSSAVPAGTVELDLPGLGVHRHDVWSNLRSGAAALREAWDQMHGGVDPDGERLSQLASREDRSLLARIALGEALEALDPAARAVVKGRAIRMSIRSEFPVGSGFGSSAAIAVAVIRAVFELADRDLSDKRLHEVSLEVERRQHGSPSGIDNATVIHGGVVWVERRDGGLHIEPMQAASELFEHIRIFQTGEPAESTGDVVTAVRRLRQRDERAFDDRLDAMTASTEAFRDLLASAAADSWAPAIEHFRRFETCLEAIGVVPEAVRERIRRIEASGGAAKISGAGSLAGPGAGSLLVLHPEPGVLDSLGVLDGFERLEVRLGGDGLRVDSPGDEAE